MPSAAYVLVFIFAAEVKKVSHELEMNRVGKRVQERAEGKKFIDGEVGSNSESSGKRETAEGFVGKGRMQAGISEELAVLLPQRRGRGAWARWGRGRTHEGDGRTGGVDVRAGGVTGRGRRGRGGPRPRVHSRDSAGCTPPPGALLRGGKQAAAHLALGEG